MKHRYIGNPGIVGWICIDINAVKELSASIKLKSRSGNIYKFLLEFPWKPLICTKCKVFGHNLTGCEKQIPKAAHSVRIDQTMRKNNGNVKSTQMAWRKRNIDTRRSQMSRSLKPP
ncbi:hypothetical protein IFM89_009431 [Coptis chinensis]|uniref:DUF4283 domain-containing protein n=1 Tax=Coptis chinensis TaxID=261450 RepID=A0A835I8Q9_9MAGN|nr:hypothetical protein IFM89_009431 [Coptis chinensis]